MNWLDFREPASAWTHLFWLALAIPAAVLLCWLARGDVVKRAGVQVFGFSLIFCSAGSFLFHAAPAWLAGPFRAMDHIGIYLLIAGTVTPIALVILRGRWRIGLLGGIWALAFAGIALRLAVVLPVSVLTVFYLVMGWVGGAVYFELVKRLPSVAVRPIWIGGLFYSVGAVCNRLHWPVIVAGVFGAHAVFHLFVIAGSAWHYYFMLSAIVPYQEKPVLLAEQRVREAVPSLAMRPADEAAGLFSGVQSTPPGLPG